MKNFDWTKFTRRTAVKSSLSVLYDAWAKPSGLEKWFLKRAAFFDKDGKPANENTPVQKDFTYEWNWFLYGPTEKGKITEANGKDFLQFTFAGECLVEIRLSEQDGYVIVELTQKNIPADDESKQQIRLGCDSGWQFYMVNLKSVYEGGLDLRNKDVRLRGLVNN